MWGGVGEVELPPLTGRFGVRRCAPQNIVSVHMLGVYFKIQTLLRHSKPEKLPEKTVGNHRNIIGKSQEFYKGMF